jgi:TPR repeat protein
MHPKLPALLPILTLFILVQGCVSAPDTARELTLTDAINKGDIQSVQDQILDGADINRRVGENEAWTSIEYPEHWSEGFTPLHIAACRGDIEMVLLLLDAGADPHLRTPDGQLAWELTEYYSQIDPAQKYESTWDELSPGYAPEHGAVADLLLEVTLSDAEMQVERDRAEKFGRALALQMLDGSNPQQALQQHGPKLRQQAIAGQRRLATSAGFWALRTLAEEYGTGFPEPPEEMQHESLVNFSAKGSMLVGHLPADQLLDLLSYEALCLQPGAMVTLQMMYVHGLAAETPDNVIQPHDPRVREVFMKLADEKVPRGQLFLGQIHLHGAGVVQDTDKGLKLLRASGLGDAMILIGDYFYEAGDKQRAYLEWVLAGNRYGHPEGWYNASVVARELGETEAAVNLLEQLLQADPAHLKAKIDLGAYLMQGIGTEQDTSRAAELFRQVRDAEDALAEYKAMAERNLEALGK